MKKLLIILGLFFITQVSFAQTLNRSIRISADPSLVRSLSSAGEEISGNPFLFSEWKAATVVFMDNSFKNMNALIKYNLIANEILVKQNDIEGVFQEDIKEFIINDGSQNAIFRKGFSGDRLKKGDFVEVLYDGSTKLLKKIEKIVIESKGYNTGTIERKVDQSLRYYIVKNDMVSEVKLNEKSILDYFKLSNLSSYINQNKLNLKKESDLIQLIKYIDK